MTVSPVDAGFLARALLWAEGVGVLVDSQFKQRREHFPTEVAAVGQLLLVCSDVLQELIQLMEGLGARLQHTFINLAKKKRKKLNLIFPPLKYSTET